MSKTGTVRDREGLEALVLDALISVHEELGEAQFPASLNAIQARIKGGRIPSPSSILRACKSLDTQGAIQMFAPAGDGRNRRPYTFTINAERPTALPRQTTRRKVGRPRRSPMTDAVTTILNDPLADVMKTAEQIRRRRESALAELRACDELVARLQAAVAVGRRAQVAEPAASSRGPLRISARRGVEAVPA